MWHQPHPSNLQIMASLCIYILALLHRVQDESALLLSPLDSTADAKDITQPAAFAI